MALLSAQGMDSFFSSSTAWVTTLSMPRLRSMGLALIATIFLPSRTIAWASSLNSICFAVIGFTFHYQVVIRQVSDIKKGGFFMF